jgi:hypothetical protein
VAGLVWAIYIIFSAFVQVGRGWLFLTQTAMAGLNMWLFITMPNPSGSLERRDRPQTLGLK